MLDSEMSEFRHLIVAVVLAALPTLLVGCFQGFGADEDNTHVYEEHMPVEMIPFIMLQCSRQERVQCLRGNYIPSFPLLLSLARGCPGPPVKLSCVS